MSIESRLLEAFKYWFPDETIMEEQYPEARGIWMEHIALIQRAEAAKAANQPVGKTFNQWLEWKFDGGHKPIQDTIEWMQCAWNAATANKRESGEQELRDARLIASLRHQIRVLEDIKLQRFHNEDCWIYQGDVNDHPESLTCPVVISAEKFRELLSKIEGEPI